jgi:ABC-type uncharacterized transport system auxiliary subunit
MVKLHLIALGALLTVGCATTRPVHYYRLSSAPATGVQPKPDGSTLLVGAIVTPESLEDARIRYNAGANATGSYEYHRWSERPGTMVGYSLVRALRASGQYARVMVSSSSAVGDYLVRGRLHEFAEVDDPGIGTRISLHLELIDFKTNRSIWDHQFERQEPANGKTIDDVVASMDRNLQQVVNAATAEIDRFLASAAPAGPRPAEPRP